MIYINLLPQELVPRQRNVLPYVAVAALAVVLTVWIVGARISVSTGRTEKTAERQRIQAELDSYADAVKVVERLLLEQDRLALKDQAILEITAGRTVWSHELYELAGLVPEEIWLHELNLGARRRPVLVEKPNPNRTQGAPATITVTEIRSFPALVMTGYALSPYREEGVRLVGEFITNIKRDEEFSVRFVDPEMRQIERQNFEDHTVMRFVMDVEIRG